MLLRFKSGRPPETRTIANRPWQWVPTLFFAQGLPFVVILTLSVVMYKRMGMTNAKLALYTAWLYLPWAIRPLWSPFIELFRSRRFWLVWMQLLVGLAFAGVALSLPGTDAFRYSMLFLWLAAFASATNDMAIDGFYMMGLDLYQQARFTGVRNVAYRLAMISGQGLIVIFAGRLETELGDISRAWMFTFMLLAAIMLITGIWHAARLPYPDEDRPRAPAAGELLHRRIMEPFRAFLQKPGLGMIVTFLLFYRMGEAQLLRMIPPFLLDAHSAGGLGLSTEQLGWYYGTVGVAAMISGGLLGGFLAARDGLKQWMWGMFISLQLPGVTYFLLAHFQPQLILPIALGIAVEQFCFGFSFSIYIFFLIYAARGEWKTTHFALATGLMSLGTMLPGMISGWIQEQVGYRLFFIWVLLCGLPGLWLTLRINIDPEYGKRPASENL